MNYINPPRIYKQGNPPDQTIGGGDGQIFPVPWTDDLWIDMTNHLTKRCTAMNPYVWASIEGAIVTTVDGDLIYNIVFNEDNAVINAVSSVTYGSGFTGLYAESINYGSAAQFQVQGTHGSINPGMTFAQATHNTFASLSVAIKAGSGGAAPGSGISIIRSSTNFVNNQASTVLHAFFPASGNLIAVTCENDKNNGAGLASVSDSLSNTYTAVVTGGAFFPSFFFAANPSVSNALDVSFHIDVGTGPSIIEIFDITGAATSPLDTAATAANSSTLTGASSGSTKNSGTQGSAGADYMATVMDCLE